MTLFIALALLFGDDLVPAGTINRALSMKPSTIISSPENGTRAFASGYQSRFFPNSAMTQNFEPDSPPLENLVLFGTVESNPWLSHFAKSLPFSFATHSVTVEGEKYTGSNLRLIAAIKNPANLEKRVVIYTAEREEDVPGINGLYHGPTEWVLGDGDVILASGNFQGRALLPEEMARDLEVLAKKIEAVHPKCAEDLPVEIGEALFAAEGEILEAMTRDEFWFVLNRVLLSLEDAHSTMSSRSFENSHAFGETLPLPVHWLENGIVVRIDTDMLRCGDVIKSIEGHRAESLLDSLATLIPAENTHWIRAMGERFLTDLSSLRGLGIIADTPVSLKIERGDEEIELALPTGRLPIEPPRKPWVRFSIFPKESLGVFVLDRCENNQEYKDSLDAFFEAVYANEIRRVAVDLRQNSGGNSSVVDEFLRYVDVLKYKSYGAIVRHSEDSLSQRGYEANIGLQAYPRMVRTNETPVDRIPFDGELYALTSNRTFSSGNWFAVILQDNDLGEIWGEATGNAPSCYGDILQFELPESELSFSLSYKQWLRPNAERDPAVTLIPDRLILRTREDIKMSRDSVIDALLKEG